MISSLFIFKEKKRKRDEIYMLKSLDTLVIDRTIRGTLFDKTTKDVLFTINQIVDPSLEVSGEKVFATDATGVKIATFSRSKNATFSASNTQINLGLLASQFGKAKEVADVGSEILSPKFEMIEVGGAPNTSIQLEKVPVGAENAEIPYIHVLNQDKSLGTKFTVGATASETEFAIDAATKTITLPTGAGITATDTIAVWYEYEASSAVKIENNADETPMGGQFKLEVLFADLCDPNIKYHGYVVFPSVKMNSDFSLNFTTEGNHAFGFEAMVDYCSNNKNLFYILLSE